eukprot:20299-Heterococcus_DN1.PRE.2
MTRPQNRMTTFVRVSPHTHKRYMLYLLLLLSLLPLTAAAAAAAAAAAKPMDITSHDHHEHNNSLSLVIDRHTRTHAAAVMRRSLCSAYCGGYCC